MKWKNWQHFFFLLFFTKANFLAQLTSAISNDDVKDNTGFVYSNNNVNLGNLGSLNSGVNLEGGPKLLGPNVCTKQEP